MRFSPRKNDTEPAISYLTFKANLWSSLTSLDCQKNFYVSPSNSSIMDLYDKWEPSETKLSIHISCIKSHMGSTKEKLFRSSVLSLNWFENFKNACFMWWLSQDASLNLSLQSLRNPHHDTHYVDTRVSLKWQPVLCSSLSVSRSLRRH